MAENPFREFLEPRQPDLRNTRCRKTGVGSFAILHFMIDGRWWTSSALAARLEPLGYERAPMRRRLRALHRRGWLERIPNPARVADRQEANRTMRAGIGGFHWLGGSAYCDWAYRITARGREAHAALLANGGRGRDAYQAGRKKKPPRRSGEGA